MPKAPVDTSKYNTLDEHHFTWPHALAQWISIKLVWIYVHTVYHLRVKGKENQPKGWQSYVAACNHVSSLDPPVLSLILDFQPVAYMAKAELFEKPLMRWYLRSVSGFSVRREKLEVSTVKTALKVLRHGKWALGIFPEGTRQKDGSLGEPKKGAAYFAKAANVPVLPVGVYLSGKRMEARIGQLIPPEADLDAFTRKIQQAIADLVEQGKADLEAGR